MRRLEVPPLEDLRRRRSAKWQVHPPDVLPLPVAEMDFRLAPAIEEALVTAVRLGDTGYGVADAKLGQALAGFAAARWGWQIDPSRTTYATDVGVAAIDLLRLLCRPGDRVVVNPPTYPPFFSWVTQVGARLAEVPLRRGPAGEWRLDLELLERAFAQRPVAYLLCSPHNPVGCVHTAEELAEVARLARLYGVTVIADEIHAPLVLPGATFTPFLTVPGGAEVGVSLHSASKTWNLAGLKCAAIVWGSSRTEELVRRRPADAVWHVGHFGVLASIAAYDDGADWLDALLTTLDDRRGHFGRLLADCLPELSWMPPQATFLAWLDCTRVGSGAEPRDTFLRHGRVALEPGPQFGAEGSGFVRLNLATSAEILDEAVRRMRAALDRAGTED